MIHKLEICKAEYAFVILVFFFSFHDSGLQIFDLIYSNFNRYVTNDPGDYYSIGKGQPVLCNMFGSHSFVHD